MESLFGMIVIIYLIASVVGAVLQRMQQGPIKGDETLPKRSPRQPSQAKPVETVGPPSVPSETLQPTMGEGQTTEVFDMAEGDESDPIPVSASQVSDAVQGLESAVPKAPKSWSFVEGEWDWDEEIATHDKWRRTKQVAGALDVKAQSPIGEVTAGEWRRAVIMAEILGKPRALRPFRPVGMR
ncbi:MAG: hypothetical protein GX369_08180 [Euryarchaeota archaeon]|nr:hypothetical protein [Euryarchaeota archaeon]